MDVPELHRSPHFIAEPGKNSIFVLWEPNKKPHIMKHFHFALIAAVLMMTACNTWKSVPDRMDRFVANAEEKSSTYSAEDWEKSKADYQALISEFSEHEDQYSSEEKVRVMKDIGRYHALLVVNGLNEAASYLNTLKQILPSYLDGIGEVVNENKEGVLGMIRDILSPSGIGESLKDLMEDIDDLAEDASEELEDRVDEIEELLDDWDE